MKTINLKPLLKKFSSGWVAISKDYKKVVASGKSLKEVTQKVDREGNPKVLLIPGAKNYRGYVTTDE